MALPASLSEITVTHEYAKFSDGSVPTEGTVTFAPPDNTWLLAIPEAVSVIPDGPRTTAVVDGAWSITVPITNDPDLATSFTYKVTEKIGNKTRTSNVEIPSSLLPGPVKFSDVTVLGAPVVTGNTALTKATADTLYAAIGTTGDGGVSSWAEISVLPDFPGPFADEAHSHEISHVAGLQDALDTKVPTTRTIAGKPLSADVTLAKADVGLSNVDNTADADKPVSTAQQTALDVRLTYRAIGTVTLSGNLVAAPDTATYLADPGAVDGDIVLTLAE